MDILFHSCTQTFDIFPGQRTPLAISKRLWDPRDGVETLLPHPWRPAATSGLTASGASGTKLCKVSFMAFCIQRA